MRVLVDVGLLQGATIDPTYLLIGHPTQGLIGTGTVAPDDVLVDYSGRLMSMSVQRTSSRRVGPVIEYNAGTAAVTLLNDDGALDPHAIEAAGLAAPGVIMRIRVLHDGVTYPVWSGYVDAWVPEHRAPDHAAVTITGTDGMSRLAGFHRAALDVPVGGGETTGARINRILDSVGWPAGDRVIATGDATLQATLAEGEALEDAQQVALNEVGEFYVDPEGRMVFRNRHAILTDTRSVTSQATFGSDRAAGELTYVGMPGVSYDRQQLVNRVTATIEGGTPQTAEDATSIARYGLYPHDQALLLESDAAAAGWASYVLRQDHLPEFRFSSIEVDTRVDPDVLVPQALGRQFGDRITVVRRPPGGIVDSREVFIRSIEHTWAPPDAWRTTWGLQPADRYLFFVVGHPSMGVIGSNAIAY
ncbi:hypothetical protein OG989_04060 [Micromonospora sp. NBC_01740]|uniref:hypothetical protein n=1 Tax=Micromonospora sp. NBC_01740 TaxID=2975986 RepID=UPI002E0D879B|nr:hypothetical protein OG989_04060 [Micromonospora sp. NBC_01740]